MEVEIELELSSGGNVKLTFPEPGDFPSFYVLSMEYSGYPQFWELLAKLMAAAGRPVCAVHQGLRQQELSPASVTQSSMQRLLQRRGYGFGVLFDCDPALADPVIGVGQKLLLLRDPRSALVTRYHHMLHSPQYPLVARYHDSNPRTGEAQVAVAAATNFQEFLRLPEVESMLERYRRFAKLRHNERNLTLIRYEHALAGWQTIASDIVATLKLPIDPATVVTIAAAAAPIGAQPPARIVAANPGVSPFVAGLAPPEICALEARVADVLLVFGYAPLIGVDDRSGALSAGSGVKNEIAPHSDAASPKTLETAKLGTIGSPLFRSIVELDPELGVRLRPNSSTEMRVLGRRVVMEVDAAGCRPVEGQPAVGKRTLSVYGCSFTFGNAIAAKETFCSLLQAMLPDWRVENHGVIGYSTMRNLIQLERATRWNKPDLVAFCWIQHHLLRNIASIPWIQTISENQSRDVAAAGLPGQQARAGLDVEGALEMRSVRVPRHDLLGIDCSDFVPDLYYLELVCFRLLERAHQLVAGHGGHFFVTTLQGHPSATLTRRLAESGIPVVDASLNGKEYLCLPDDSHPNALANRIYAQRMHGYLSQFTNA
jgi:hypothetical protein